MNFVSLEFQFLSGNTIHCSPRDQSLSVSFTFIHPAPFNNAKFFDLFLSVGNTSGRIGGKEYFHCPPNYGRVVRLSDIHAVRNPRVGISLCVLVVSSNR